LSLCYLHLLHIRLLPRSTLFPYTTLFRSLLLHQLAEFFELIEKNKAVDNRHINIKKDQTGKVLGSVFVLPKVIQRSFAGPLHFYPLCKSSYLDNALADKVIDRKSTRLNSSHVKISY